jgi:uncharacterized membrane protein YdjX (TVP38/TMEM64 family)
MTADPRFMPDRPARVDVRQAAASPQPGDIGGPSGAYGRGPVRALLAIVVVLAILALGVATIDPLRDAVQLALGGDIDGLRTELRGLGAGGAAVLFVLILVHSVVLFPAEIANAAAGLMYGFAGGFALVMTAWTASLLLAYGLGATAGRPLALRLAGQRRVELAERVVDRGGVPALLLARLVPFIPMSLVGYVAGAARVPLWRYTWTTVVGIIPITAAATYLGHALDDFSLSDPLVWVAVAVVIVLVGATMVAVRRMRTATGRPS